MKNNKVFLLDAFALIYRAYFAFSKNPRISSKGLNTSAIIGFANTLMEILEKQNPEYIAVVFDSSGPTFRHDKFSEYKANREAMPEDIRKAIPYIKQLIDELNITRVELSGYEADDLIGTLAHQAADLGKEVYMMTPDKDYAQLVKENVFMYKPSRSGNGPETLGVKEICEKFEIEDPIQVIDILGLWGDAVDNIPGVPGVGEKTAKKLIGLYGSIEGLYEHTHELKGKQKENVEANKAQAFLSKELATIILDCPVQFEEEQYSRREHKGESLKKLLVELEFRRLTTKLFGTAPITNPGDQIDMFGSTGNVELELADLRSLDSAKVDYQLIESESALKVVLSELSKAKIVSFDTETTGLNTMTDRVVGISFSMEENKAYYIPFDQKYVNDLQEFFSDVSKIWVGQNIKYDLHLLRNEGVQVKGTLFDTMLAHYLLEPDQKHGMDFLAHKYLNYTTISIESVIGKKGKNQKNMADLEASDVCDYACEDADITLQLFKIFSSKLKDLPAIHKLFEEVEMKLVPVLLEMETNGINLDTKALNDFSKELEVIELKLHDSIINHAGQEFNVASPKQLGEILFEKLELDAKAKKTKTGQYSTSEDVLLKLEKKHPIISEILDYRGVKKLKSTYVDALPELVNLDTGKIHTSYNQAVAATGRLSSVNPNLQNIPIRTERGKEVRKAFIPSEGNVLLAADYSQVELRIMAAISKDQGMIEAFQNGLDIHAATAAKVFDIDINEVDREQRSKAKMVNFGIIYGISAFGLSQRLGISRKEAKEIIDNYFEKYSAVKGFMDSAIQNARENGFVETIMGRRRILNDINSKNAIVRGFAERNAINAPIQGSAADVIKVAMINIFNEMKKEKLKSKMVLQVHDELIFDVLPNELEQLSRIVVDKMEHAVNLCVPLEVDYNTGDNWLQAH